MKSGRQKAYAFLKETVLTDPAMQGEFLSGQAIADRIGVSRTPIREALLLLAAALLIPQAALLPLASRYWEGGRGRHIAAGLLVAVAAVLAWRLAWWAGV